MPFKWRINCQAVRRAGEIVTGTVGHLTDVNAETDPHKEHKRWVPQAPARYAPEGPTLLCTFLYRL